MEHCCGWAEGGRCAKLGWGVELRGRTVRNFPVQSITICTPMPFQSTCARKAAAALVCSAGTVLVLERVQVLVRVPEACAGACAGGGCRCVCRRRVLVRVLEAPG